MLQPTLVFEGPASSTTESRDLFTPRPSVLSLLLMPPLALGPAMLAPVSLLSRSLSLSRSRCLSLSLSRSRSRPSNVPGKLNMTSLSRPGDIPVVAGRCGLADGGGGGAKGLLEPNPVGCGRSGEEGV